MKRFWQRPLLALLLALPLGWSRCVQAADYPADSNWSTFWGAMVDELTGQPSVEALKSTARFAEAGIAFDYPDVLRVNYDAEKQEWRLWRGDFELEVQTHETYNPEHARSLLELLQSFLHSKRGGEAEALETVPAVRWCERDVTGVRMRLTFVGDVHEFIAYDLPLASGGSRLLLFEDVLQAGKRSRTADAVQAMVSASLTCSGS